MERNVNTLGARIQWLRTGKRDDFSSYETQAQLADSLSEILGKRIAREAVNQWESNSRTIKPEALAAIAKHYHVTVDWLLGRTEEWRVRSAAADELGLDPNTVLRLHCWSRGGHNTAIDDFVDFLECETTSWGEQASSVYDIVTGASTRPELDGMTELPPELMRSYYARELGDMFNAYLREKYIMPKE